MKKYIILSAGRSGDFGSTTLINEDVWNFLNNKEIDSLSEETLNEIKSFLNNPTEEELIDELENLTYVQSFHCFISNLTYEGYEPTFAIEFKKLTDLVNYCVNNNIEISNETFDD